MISQESAIDNARAIAKHNNFVWREDDIHVEWREAKTASKNWFKRRFFSDYAGHPACWLVRVGQPPTGDEWLDEGIDEFFMKPGGEGFGYLFDAETGEFIGVDVGFKVALKREISLKTPD